MDEASFVEPYRAEAEGLSAQRVMERPPVPLDVLLAEGRQLASLFEAFRRPLEPGLVGFGGTPRLVGADLGARLDGLVSAIHEVETRRLLEAHRAVEAAERRRALAGRLIREVRLGLGLMLEGTLSARQLKTLRARHRQPRRSDEALGRAVTDYAALAREHAAKLALLPRDLGPLLAQSDSLAMALSRPPRADGWMALRRRLVTLLVSDMRHLRAVAKALWAASDPEVATLFRSGYRAKKRR